MVIYYLFAFDHKLLNLKNIIGRKTELCIHLYLYKPHILSACCIPGSAAPRQVWNIKGETQLGKTAAFSGCALVFYKPSPSGGHMGSQFLDLADG